MNFYLYNDFKVSATANGNNVAYPCNNCLVPGEKLTDIGKQFDARSESWMKDIIKTRNALKTHSVHPVQVFGFVNRVSI